MTKHTPGPWIIWQDDPDLDPADDLDIIQDGDGPESDRTIATVRVCPEKSANSRLIAAAPELLAVICKLKAFAEMHASVSAAGYTDACMGAAKAISKAKGAETP